MKKLFGLMIVFILLLYSGCEQPLGEDEFPFELKLVIRCIIEEGKIIDSIYVGRTLPVSVPFREDFAKVTDAVGAVVSDGIFYPLRYKGNGYYTTDSLRALRNKSYSLLVNWENISANSETRIPVFGTINNSYVSQGVKDGESYLFLESSVTPFLDEVYGATWFLLSYNGFMVSEADQFASIVRKSSNSLNILVPTVEIPQSYISAPGSYGIRLYTYDAAFYDYFISSGSGQIPDAIFGQPGINVKWNINGDGIGMFIGRADTLIIIGTN